MWLVNPSPIQRRREIPKLVSQFFKTEFSKFSGVKIHDPANRTFPKFI